MALDATKVRLAAYGNVWIADSGTTLPTDATTAMGTVDAAYADLGYLSEEGIVEAHEDTTQSFKAWQYGTTLREQITEQVTRFTMTFVETNAVVEELYYGATRSSGALAVKNFTPPELVLVIETIDGSTKHRLVAERAQLTARGDVARNSTSLTGYPVTLTIYPSASTDNLWIDYEDTI